MWSSPRHPHHHVPAPCARWMARCAEQDLRSAIALHRTAARPGVVTLLVAASRLGDGVVWYLAIAALALIGLFGGPRAWVCGAEMLAVGALNLAIYWCVKHVVGRQRPFVDCPDIHACTRPLDPFSFPSGHTLHAVAFGMVLSHHYPALSLLLWSYAGLVAASRVVLGLHYPSDVLAGAATGFLTASAVLALPY